MAHMSYQLEDELLLVQLTELVSRPSPGHRRLVLVPVDKERGRAVHRGHHGLEAATLELVGRYLAHRRRGAAIAAGGRAHGGRTLVARRRRNRRISRAPATIGRSVRHEPLVHGVSGRFSEKKKNK